MTREEAIKRFQRMKKILSISNSDAARMIEALDMAIEALQTDTAEIVRCKDCKHRYYADNRVPHERTWVCERFSNEEITDNDFCSYGERREE